MLNELFKPAEIINFGVARPAPITERVSENSVSPYVGIAMERWVKPVVCPDMYADMVSKMNALPCNYNPALTLVEKFPNDALYESLWIDGKLYQMGSWAVLYESYAFNHNQYRQIGFQNVNGKNSVSVDLNAVRFMMDETMQKIVILTDVVRGYLQRNATDYPLYNCHDDKCKPKHDGTLLQFGIVN